MPTAKHSYNDPDPVPMYFLLFFIILLSAYIVWLGSVAVSLYLYKGALAPEPERFVILPAYVCDHSSQRGQNRRDTVFPIPTPPKNASREFSLLSLARRVDIATLDVNELPDPEIRAFFAEQQRISRLPAFVQDDCGDGSDFPDVPFAITPVEVKQRTLAPSGISTTLSTDYEFMGLKKLDQKDWLIIDNTHEFLHHAQDSLLSKMNTECIQVKGEGEAACIELLQEIVIYLVSKYPEKFSIRNLNRRKYIRNETTKEEWSLVRPFDCHPLEVCARLAMEDFNILLKGEFTQQYYFQASATVFPAGWCMRNLIGKPLSSLQAENIYQWDDIPNILPLTSNTQPLSRSTLYIQTHPNSLPLAHLLFIQEPKDFFPGDLSALTPQHIIVRREHQVFRRLPKSDAVVYSTKTEVRKLTDLDVVERRELCNEIIGWSKDVAARKGLELWQNTVFKWCEGKKSL